MAKPQQSPLLVIFLKLFSWSRQPDQIQTILKHHSSSVLISIALGLLSLAVWTFKFRPTHYAIQSFIWLNSASDGVATSAFTERSSPLCPVTMGRKSKSKRWMVVSYLFCLLLFKVWTLISSLIGPLAGEEVKLKCLNNFLILHAINSSPEAGRSNSESSAGIYYYCYLCSRRTRILNTQRENSSIYHFSYQKIVIFLAIGNIKSSLVVETKRREIRSSMERDDQFIS